MRKIKHTLRAPGLGALTVGALLFTACGNDPTGVVDGGFAYRVSLNVAESFPVQLGLEVEVENVDSNTATISFPDGCVVLMRVYDGDELVWALGHTVACTDAIVSVELEPGETETFRVGLISAADILGDSLPDGEYRITAYLRPDGEIELDAGTVELGIPR